MLSAPSQAPEASQAVHPSSKERARGVFVNQSSQVNSSQHFDLT